MVDSKSTYFIGARRAVSREEQEPNDYTPTWRVGDQAALYQAAGRVMRDIRKESDMRQTEAAAVFGVNPPAWSRRENGFERLTLWEMVVLCRRLGVDPCACLAQILRSWTEIRDNVKESHEQT